MFFERYVRKMDTSCYARRVAAGLWLGSRLWAVWSPTPDAFLVARGCPGPGVLCQGKLELILFRLAVDEAVDLPWVLILQRDREEFLGNVLVGDRAQEAVDGEGSHGGGAGV
ncbi:hypothetical protein ABIA70_003468 [Arthrobacter sp. 754]